jgi:hypothetical protein
MSKQRRMITGIVLLALSLIFAAIGVLRNDMGGLGALLAGLPEGPVSFAAHPVGYIGGLLINLAIAAIGLREIRAARAMP